MKNYKKAFTLIEVIVALTVFSIGILGVQTYFATSSRLTTAANHMSTASNLAQGIIDTQLSYAYDELIPGTSAKVRVSTDSASPFYNYQKQVTISLIDSSLNTSATDVGLKKILVTVFYSEGAIEKNVQMATIQTKR